MDLVLGSTREVWQAADVLVELSFMIGRALWKGGLGFRGFEAIFSLGYLCRNKRMCSRASAGYFGH